MPAGPVRHVATRRPFRRSSLNGYTRSAARSAATALSDDSATTQFTVFSEGPRRPGPRSACVVVIHGNGLGRRIDLGSRPVLIGRADDSTLVLSDDYASERHARLSKRGDDWYVEDLGSTNGTFLDRGKVTTAVRAPLNTPIRIGKTVIELRS